MSKEFKKSNLTITISLAIMIGSLLLLLFSSIAQAQWYIDDEGTYGMSYWGEDAENLQEGGGQRLPSGVTPDFELKMDVYLSFRPNPVGVNQPILVNTWTVPGPSFVRYFTDLKVTLTKPDGTTDVVAFDTFRADSTAYFEYVVNQVGEWKLKLDVPGQYFPAGNYTMPEGTSRSGYTDSYTRSCYYKPASTSEQTLTVQEDIVYSWPESQLPTDYWTRPIQPENREWWIIGGDYPWRGPTGGPTWEELYPDTYSYYTAYTGFFASDNQRFTPWVQAPNSAHIVWKRKTQLSGLIGANWGYESGTSGSGTPTVIYQGMAYQSVRKPFNGISQNVLECYDIRTGEIFWEIPDVPAPTFIEYSEGLPSVPGATAAVRTSATLIAMSGNRLIKYDPATGRTTVNVTIPQWSSISGFATSVYYKNGYVLSVQELSPTGGPGEFGTPTAGIYRLVNWTTLGSSSNFNSRILSNISWPVAYIGDMADFGSCISFRMVETSWFDTVVTGFPYAYIPYDNASGIRYGTRIKAFDLKTGQEIWDKNWFESIYHPSASIAYNGKVVVLTQDQEQTNAGGYYMCFDQRSGNLLWKSEQMDYPWDVPGFGAYSMACAYGMFFRFGYSGIYAFDWDDGSIVWKYEGEAFAPYETPYIDADGNTMYSWNAGGWLADGKLYAVNTEHTASQPITRGWGIHCINVSTGDLIWKTKTAGSLGAVADGYLTLSGSDGIMYVYGKGKSATTVTASPKTAAKGSTVLIEGTILDQSPAQPDTPCVSKDSMALQMEYLHKQMPIDGLWGNETLTGVPVALTAIGEDGSYIDIGTTTTSGYHGTFGLAWTSPEEGTYEIVASFEGDESYGSSEASTFVTVGPATSPDVPIEPATETSLLTTIAIIAAVVIIAIAGIAAFLIIKQRK